MQYSELVVDQKNRLMRVKRMIESNEPLNVMYNCQEVLGLVFVWKVSDDEIRAVEILIQARSNFSPKRGSYDGTTRKTCQF